VATENPPRSRDHIQGGKPFSRNSASKLGGPARLVKGAGQEHFWGIDCSATEKNGELFPKTGGVVKREKLVPPRPLSYLKGPIYVGKNKHVDCSIQGWPEASPERKALLPENLTTDRRQTEEKGTQARD